MHSHAPLSFSVTHHAGSPGFPTDLSVPAAPNHPGKPGSCMRTFLHCRRLASPSLTGWPLPTCVTRLNRVHQCCGWHLRLPGLRRLDCSRHRPVGFMSNVQFTWQAPFSLRGQLSFAQRTRGHRGHREEGEEGAEGSGRQHRCARRRSISTARTRSSEAMFAIGTPSCLFSVPSVVKQGSRGSAAPYPSPLHGSKKPLAGARSTVN